MIAVPIKYVQNRCPGSQDGTKVATALVSVKCCDAKTAMGRAKNKGPRAKILSVPCACNTPLPSLKMPIAKIEIPAKYGQNTVPGIEAKIHSPKRRQKVGVLNLNLPLYVSMAGGPVFPSTQEPLWPSAYLPTSRFSGGKTAHPLPTPQRVRGCYRWLPLLPLAPGDAIRSCEFSARRDPLSVSFRWAAPPAGCRCKNETGLAKRVCRRTHWYR